MPNFLQLGDVVSIMKNENYKGTKFGRDCKCGIEYVESEMSLRDPSVNR